MTRSGEEIRTSRSPAWTYASDAFAMLETLARSADGLEVRLDDHHALAVLLVDPALDAAVVIEDHQIDLVVGVAAADLGHPGDVEQCVLDLPQLAVRVLELGHAEHPAPHLAHRHLGAGRVVG